MSETLHLSVPPEVAGLRLDVFMAMHLPELSRSRCQQLVRDGQVQVNDVSVMKPSLILRGGEQIVVTLPEPEPTTLQPENLPLSILYEDDDLLAVNKPRGMVVHPGRGMRKGTMVNALLALDISLSDIAGQERLGIVHRLDKGTSGILLVAKTNFAHLALAKQFAEHTTDKCYLAIVVGEPDFEHRIIAASLMHHPDDPKLVTVASRPSPHAVAAVTEIWVRERFDGFALLELKPVTGRTHQIRVHLKHLGLPVAGDEDYGGRVKALRVARERKRSDLVKALQDLNGQALHAWRITFIHPRTGEPLTFEAPLPDDMIEFLKLLR